MTFVLVHGINDNCLKLKALQTAFENDGHRCIVPSLTPKNASKGLEYLAKQLQAIIGAQLENATPPSCLVGFSMGGLIARYYLQELEGHKIFSHFFSIAAPHHGSFLAYLSSNLGVRQMRPNSHFIRSLEQSSDRIQAMACYSYWTPFDLMILPATSSRWNRAENIRLYCLSHPLMVKNNGLIADILEKSKQA